MKPNTFIFEARRGGAKLMIVVVEETELKATDVARRIGMERTARIGLTGEFFFSVVIQLPVTGTAVFFV
jgi:hypothetical protein